MTGGGTVQLKKKHHNQQPRRIAFSHWLPGGRGWTSRKSFGAYGGPAALSCIKKGRGTRKTSSGPQESPAFLTESPIFFWLPESPPLLGSIRKPLLGASIGNLNTQELWSHFTNTSPHNSPQLILSISYPRIHLCSNRWVAKVVHSICSRGSGALRPTRPQVRPGRHGTMPDVVAPSAPRTK